MPLSSKGLWEAERTTPPCASRRRVRYAMPGVGRTPDGENIGARGQRARDQRALEHGARQPRVAPHHQPHGRDPVVLEQRGHELATEAKRQLGRQRRLVGDAADAVGAEEPAHDGAPGTRSERGDGPATRITRMREGLTRTTVTPTGTVT